ncbi:MAG: primosomal protein N' [Thiohalomonadales bacterium]
MADKIPSQQTLLVATPLPLRFPLSYREPIRSDNSFFELTIMPGTRVRVSLGSRKVVGVVIATNLNCVTAIGKLKPIIEVLDTTPLLDPALLKLLDWAVAYYQHPIGQVYQYILPTLLRQGKSAQQTQVEAWQLTPFGIETDITQLSRSPKQSQLVQALRDAAAQTLSADFLTANLPSWRSAMKQLLAKGWVLKKQLKPVYEAIEIQAAEFDITAEQSQVIDDISDSLGSFKVHLLQGVTGSGKTEVYLRLAMQAIAAGRQVLVLIPEIGLSPQMLQRFQQRLSSLVVMLHSGLGSKARLNNWLSAQQGDAGVVIGTRSAVFAPMPRLGLIIVDEEHDISFKQQDGFRYFARDVAIKRAQLLSIPVVLGTATPSFESLQNASSGKYQYHHLTERVGAAAQPPVPRIIDIRSQTLRDGLSNRLIASMREHLERGDQVLLFLNRRGFAPVLMCHDCSWIAKCARCDSPMSLYRGVTRQRCSHCGSERKATTICPECQGTNLFALGEGTERVEQVLGEIFKGVEILRIDRDSMRNKDALTQVLQKVHAGGAKIMVGTQMLAKGHHFPDVTLVGILNIDQGLFSIDFRALERLAQLIVQVAGRAGRAAKPGQVVLQTHYPEHPLLQVLLSQGYEAFARSSLGERQQSAMPPYCYLCLLRAESPLEKKALAFLQEARALGEKIDRQQINLLGPMPAPMLKKAGRYRAQLLLHANDRGSRQQFLELWIPLLSQSKLSHTVRWSLDVDPMEMY